VTQPGALPEKMRELGLSHQKIAVEFARRYRLRLPGPGVKASG
jgi:hypothetical protein